MTGASQQLASLATKKRARRDTVDLIAHINEPLGYAAGATADVEDACYAIGDVGNQEVDIIFLGDVQIHHIDLEVAGPIAVMEVL